MSNLYDLIKNEGSDEAIPEKYVTNDNDILVMFSPKALIIWSNPLFKASTIAGSKLYTDFSITSKIDVNDGWICVLYITGRFVKNPVIEDINLTPVSTIKEIIER